MPAQQISASALRPALRELRAALPQGRTLPEPMWSSRHTWLLRLLWLHVPAVFGYALLEGSSPEHSLFEASIIASFALAATMLSSRDRRAASSTVALGLLTSSAVITHLSGGYIEAHFHFFVVVTLLVLYEDWLPFLIAIGFVLLHHGLAGALIAEDVFNHPGGIAQPWKWAAIHAAYITALSIGSIVAWRLNEDARAEARRAQEEAQRALEIAQFNEERFRSAFANAPIGMALLSADRSGENFGRFLRVNQALCEITGFSERQLLGMSFRDLTHPDDIGKTEEAAAALVDGSALVFENEKRYVHADGHEIPTLVTSSLMRSESGAPSFFISQIQDITARKAFEDQLAHQALHDTLTSLPNRALFRDRLEQALARIERSGGSVSILFIDLDRFKLVNDTHGHATGDEVLKLVSGRIQDVLRHADTVARFGGDEFAVLREEARGRGQATIAAFAGRIADAIAEPVTIDGRSIVLTGSIGIVLCERPDADPDTLLRDADAAMYRAKADGGGRHQLFHEQLRLEILERVEIEHALRAAVENDELVLHYQPIFDIATGEVYSVEALLRWNRPGHGLVGPEQFIGVAEETGLIVPIGGWVLREACREAASWQCAGETPGPKVAVNVAPRQLADPNLVDAVTDALEAAGLSPTRLSLELTETAMMESLEETSETMLRLGRLGVGLALDDFGTGYSSLGQLHRLPSFDVLKIDRSFTAELGTAPHARALIGAAVEMSESLGLRAAAEGVETSEQLEHLRRIGCPLAQGHHLARPQTAPALRAMIAAGARYAWDDAMASI